MPGAGRLGRLVVGVPDDQPGPGQGQHGDVPVDLVVVEGGLVVDHEVQQVLLGQGDHASRPPPVRGSTRTRRSRRAGLCAWCPASCPPSSHGPPTVTRLRLRPDARAARTSITASGPAGRGGRRWARSGPGRRAPTTELSEATQGLRVTEASCGMASASWATRCSRSSIAGDVHPRGAVPAEQHRRRLAGRGPWPRRPRWSAAAPGRRCRPAARWECPSSPSDTIGPKAASSRLVITSGHPGRRHRLDHRAGRAELVVAGQAQVGDQVLRSCQASAISSARVDVAADAGLVRPPAHRLVGRLERDVPAEPVRDGDRLVEASRTGNRGTSGIPYAASSSAVSASVSSRPVRRRRPAPGSPPAGRRPRPTSSIGTAPGSRSRQWAYARQRRQGVDRVGGGVEAGQPARLVGASRRSSAAGGSPGTPRPAAWSASAATSSRARITSSVPWSNTFTAAHTTESHVGVGQRRPGGVDEARPGRRPARAAPARARAAARPRRRCAASAAPGWPSW